MDNLPRYFALESLTNKQYLRYVHEDVVLHGHVEFSGEEVISLYTKFELEPAKNEAYTGLYNIRCCYNNRYWTRRQEGKGWITATAAEPVEDQFKWSCTLFQLSVKLSGDGKLLLTLCHAQDSRYVPVSVGSGDPTFRACLKAGPNQPVPYGGKDSGNSFSIVNWDSLVILPQLVVFKGDDGLILRHRLNAFRFEIDDAPMHTSSFEVLYNRDGSVRIRLPSSPKFMCYGSGYSVDATSISDMKPGPERNIFWLVKGRGDNELAIQSKNHKFFCQRTAAVDRTEFDFVSAFPNTKVKHAEIMRVEEPVVSRSIYNVNFRFEHARIYNQSDVIMVRKQFSNPLNVDQVIHLTQSFTKETTRTWNSIVTLKLPTPTTMEMTSIPSILDGEVGFSDEFEGRYEWGTDMKGSETTELSDHINIPARSFVTVLVIATKGKCDVPFSYMQQDTRTDGSVCTNKKDDGVYTGINYYNFRAQVVKTTPIAKNN